MIWEIVAACAALATASSTMPQVLRIWRRKKADDISLSMYLVLSTGVALWLAYGIHLGDIAIMAANAGTLAMTVAVIAMKLMFGKNKDTP